MCSTWPGSHVADDGARRKPGPAQTSANRKEISRSAISRSTRRAMSRVVSPGRLPRKAAWITSATPAYTALRIASSSSLFTARSSVSRGVASTSSTSGSAARSASHASAGRNGISTPIRPDVRPMRCSAFTAPSAAVTVPLTASMRPGIQSDSASICPRSSGLPTKNASCTRERGMPTNARYWLLPIRVELAWKW